MTEPKQTFKITAKNPAGKSVIMPGGQEQPQPTPNDLPAVWDLVIADMQARNRFGTDRYGTTLQPHNGRDGLLDAYEEALDLAVYLRMLIWERDNPEVQR